MIPLPAWRLVSDICLMLAQKETAHDIRRAPPSLESAMNLELRLRANHGWPGACPHEANRLPMWLPGRNGSLHSGQTTEKTFLPTRQDWQVQLQTCNVERPLR